MNYPRRQQYRGLCRAITTGAGGLLAAGVALLAAAQRAVWIALILLLPAMALGVRARHWTRLARRGRVGARSEEQVQRALAPLATEGWRLRHSLRWQGRGDIDCLAIAPTGIAFARPRQGHSTAAMSLGCRRWPTGCRPAVAAGAHTERSRSSASSTPGGSSASKPAC